MGHRLAFAISALMLLGCDEAMTVHVSDSGVVVESPAPSTDADSTPRCCIYFESPSPTQGACWLCGHAIVCAGEHSVCPDDMPTCTGDGIRQRGAGATTYGTDLTQCAFACRYISERVGGSEAATWCR